MTVLYYNLTKVYILSSAVLVLDVTCHKSGILPGLSGQAEFNGRLHQLKPMNWVYQVYYLGYDQLMGFNWWSLPLNSARPDSPGNIPDL